ncbi:MAG: class I SAM-dependent methyltransferase [Acidimicrobiales bacterium]|nr:class I SAM-dependent methyltransferase [Acidimicrobiales bacterium]
MRSLGAFYEHQVLPRVIDRVCGVGEIGDLRARVAEGLHGDVLEIGFGSGLNQPHLPATVRRVLAVDPAVTGRRLGARRLAASDIPVEFIGLDGEDIPLPDESVDSALSTFTLCTIPDVAVALREVHRVLRPGGQLHFLEHGLSPDVRVAKWQHRLTPLQRRIAGGCHFDRRIDEIVADAGFEVVSLDNHYLKGSPRTPGYLYEGVARKP